MDLESRETVTIHNVYTITGDFTMGAVRNEFFMDEEDAFKYLNDLLEELVEERRDEIEELEKRLEEGDFAEPPEDMQYGEEDWIKCQIDQMKEDIELLQSDDYLEKEIPVTSDGNEFPCKRKVEVIK